MALKAEDLQGKILFKISDEDADPFSQAQKRTTLTQLAPTLLQLGANPTKLLEELLRVHGLPAELSEPVEQSDQLPAGSAAATPAGSAIA